MSPQPIEMHTSPSRTSSARNDDQILATRQPDHSTTGVGLGDRVDDQLAGDPGDRDGARRVDVGEHDEIGAGERIAVFVPHLGDAVVPVGLEHRDHALPRVAAVAGRSDHCVDLRRQMGVVVDEGGAAVDAAHVESAGDAAESLERRGDVVERTPTSSAIAAAPVALTTLWIPRSGSTISPEAIARRSVAVAADQVERERPGVGAHVDGSDVAARRRVRR